MINYNCNVIFDRVHKGFIMCLLDAEGTHIFAISPVMLVKRSFKNRSHCTNMGCQTARIAPWIRLQEAKILKGPFVTGLKGL